MAPEPGADVHEPSADDWVFSASPHAIRVVVSNELEARS